MSNKRWSGDDDNTPGPSKRRRTSSDACDIAGNILKIVLKNFMCHHHLEVDLRQKINFICGKNGSGKSAILAGIVVGLGGKSSDTNRGPSVKGLIASGKKSAQVEIVLNNVGFNAFKSDVYGPQITVIRTISENSNSYKLCNHAGKVVASKRNELTKMLLCFGIKIDNPITVLNQDMARNFLKSSDTNDLYKFFSWSTGLSDIENKINCNMKHFPSLMNSLDEKKKELEYSSQDLLQIKRLHEMSQELAKLEESSTVLKNELNWSKVLTCQKELTKLQNALKHLTKNAAALKSKIDNRSNLEADIIERKNQVQEKLKKKVGENEKQRSDLLTAERIFQETSERYKKILTKKKAEEVHLLKENDNLAKLTEQLKNCSVENVQKDKIKRKLEEDKQVLEKKIKDLKSIVTVNETHHKNLTEDLNKKREILSGCNVSLQPIVVQKNKILNQLSNLKRSDNNILSVYSDYMPTLVQEINRAHERNLFDRKPVGPIGNYIKLKNEKFGPVIEKIIGKPLLSGFCVHSSRDLTTLMDIFKKMRLSKFPFVVMSPFFDKVHDVKGQEADQRVFQNLFRSLEFSHPVVANCLIDQIECENILLIPTNEEAYKYMELSENVPRNCKKAVTMDYVYFPAPNYRSYFLNPHPNVIILQTNKEQLIRGLEHSLNKVKNDEEQLRKKFNDYQEEVKKSNILVSNAEQEMTRIKREIRVSEQKLQELYNQEAPLASNEDMIKEDIVYRENCIKDIQAILEKLSQESKSVKKDLATAAAAKDKLNVLDNQQNEEISSLKDLAKEVEAEHRELLANLNKFDKKYQDEEKKIQLLRDQITASEGDFKSKQDAASQSGDEVEDPRPVAAIQEELIFVENNIEEIKRTLGNRSVTEITEEYMNKFQSLDKIQQLLNETTQSIESWRDTCGEINSNFIRKRNLVSANVKNQMSVLLKLRKYNELLDIDHKQRKLNFIIQMNSQSQQVSSVVCLSGGERSYTMVAFLLSLWKEMRVPFYFLDEFDVFMDPVNRSMVINLLMFHAKNSPHGQFVFLTPNDFQTKVDENVGIFRMQDPR